MRLDFSRCVLKPYAHQERGVLRLFDRKIYGLFWQMRLGKTKAVVDAACFLRDAGLLDVVVIACPAQVKAVWGHKELGEVRKHAFVPWKVLDYEARNEDYADILCQETKDLLFVTVSHELLRTEDARGDFPRVHGISRCVSGKKVWIVYDEASAFGNWKSMQTKSALHLSEVLKPDRKTTLDGTPIGNSQAEQYSKFKVLDRSILGYKNFFHFRAVHQISEANRFAKREKAYVGFQKQELIDAKVKPWCEYLAQEDALDMPAKVPSFATVALSPKTWKVYRDMRDEMVAELETGICSAQHAAVKSVRLAQICSGFLGGVEDDVTGLKQAVEIGDELTKATVEWVERKLVEDPKFKAVLWCRFRPEIERLVTRLRGLPKLAGRVGMVYGSARHYKDELHPDGGYDGAYVLVAQPQAVRYGVNFSKAYAEAFVSQDYNRITRAQAEDRVQPGEGVRKTTLVMDFLTTGPTGQKTVSWDIRDVLKEKADIAGRTTQEWKRILTEE